jgi:hypothetical protein
MIGAGAAYEYPRSILQRNVFQLLREGVALIRLKPRQAPVAAVKPAG